MGVTSGPRLASTDSLVLSLDAMNAKSFAGEPTSNLCTSRISDGAIAFSADGTNSPLSLTVASDTTETPFGNTAYRLTFASGSGKGTGYAAERATTANWAVDAAKTYSYGLWIAFNSDYAKSRVDGDHVYAYITGSAGMSRFSGGYNDASPTYIDAGGKRWYHYGRTARSIGASGSYNEFWTFFRNNSHFTEEVILWVAGPQFEEGSSFTPFTSTSRSVTNAWKDLSGRGNHGTFSAENFGDAGDVSLYKKGQILLPVGTDNITGSPAAINFDGSDDYVEVSSNGSTNFASQTYTISGWFKLNSSRSNDSVFFSYDHTAHSSPHYAAHFRIGTTNGILFGWNDGSSYEALEKASAVSDNTWHHFAATFTTGKQAVYIDGDEVATSTHSDTITFYSQEVWIGKGNFGGYFNGEIATAQFYNVVLSHAQVKDIYNSQRSRFGH